MKRLSPLAWKCRVEYLMDILSCGWAVEVRVEDSKFIVKYIHSQPVFSHYSDEDETLDGTEGEGEDLLEALEDCVLKIKDGLDELRGFQKSYYPTMRKAMEKYERDNTS